MPIVPQLNDRNSFHELLYAMRMTRRLPRKAIAVEAGVDVSYIAALERGSRRPPSDEKLEKILNTIGASATERQDIFLAAYLAKLPRPSPHCIDAAQILHAIPKMNTYQLRLLSQVASAIITEAKM